jgi:SpoVK/Ycf46/Vps4 family AAA+-type ATPase
MEELESLVGLTTIKEDVKELMAFVKIQKLRQDSGLKSVPVSLHLVFTGNPGTGKTTVARIIGRLYKQIGVLSQGQLVEVDRSGLVAGYVGQTALKTQEQIKKAMGGVLFIDEAYALAQKDDAFGQEAIDTVLKAMEDHRDDLVVIVAGYTKPMEKFINSNPGLKSRFNK